MSTTLSGFVVTKDPALIGAAVLAAPQVIALSDAAARQMNLDGGATRIDDQVFNLAKAGFAKNAGVGLTLTGTTAITISLAALAAATGVVIAGDTAFATWNQLIFVNTGAVDLVLSPGASNPLGLQLTGTTPALTVAAGSRVVLETVAGITVDSTHKNLTVTPTAGGTLNIGIGGA
jgi:hypothetical protein